MHDRDTPKTTLNSKPVSMAGNKSEEPNGKTNSIVKIKVAELVVNAMAKRARVTPIDPEFRDHRTCKQA